MTLMSTETTNTSNITLCRYWVKPEKEAEFRRLLERHWPTFTKLGLVGEKPPHLIFRGTEKDGRIFYVETFAWKDTDAMQRAHSLPEVASVWEPMGNCCTSMEFPFVEQIEV
jgi:hypothetical protein